MGSTLSIWIVLQILSFELKAFLHGLFGEVVRLTGHGRLVELDTGGLNAHTVNRHVDTSLDLDDITNADEVSVELLEGFLTFSDNFNLFGVLLDFEIFKELSLLGGVLPGGEKCNDCYSSKHSERLDPS